MKQAGWYFFSILIVLPFIVSAGKNDTVNESKKPFHKNVIKFNPTPLLLWSNKNVTFSYERVINGKQSIALTLGNLEFSGLLFVQLESRNVDF